MGHSLTLLHAHGGGDTNTYLDSATALTWPVTLVAREVQSVAQDAMATKVKLMKLLQEMRGFSEIRRFHPAPKTSALFLMQLRTHVAETSRSKRRLAIRVDVRDTMPVADSVKIRHIQPQPDRSSTTPVGQP